MKLKNEVKNSPYNLFLSALCSFIGVGFITGAEIWYYFARFGLNMLFGMIVFFFLNFFLTFLSFNKTNNQKCSSKVDFVVSLVSEILVASAMISGLNNLSKTMLKEWWILAFIFSIFVIYLILILGIKSFFYYNYFVLAFVVFVVCFLIFRTNYNFCNFDAMNFDFQTSCLSVLFAILYVFMNISEIKPIVSNFDSNTSKKTKFWFSILLSIVLVLIELIFSICLIFNKKLTNFSMPFLIFFNNYGNCYKIIFIFGLFLALVSTAEACLFGFEKKVQVWSKDKFFSKTFSFILSLIFGQIPFVFFVRVIYPIIAVLNLISFFVNILKKHSFKSKTIMVFC